MIDAATAALRDVATVDLYRRNAFHLTGLPTDADRRKIRQRQQQVLTALSVGADLPGSAEDDELPGPADGADPDDVRAAFSLLLEDPRRRLVDEFFWYWNADRSRCGCDPAVHEKHNQAVVAHFHVLHLELARNGEEPDEAGAEELRLRWITAGRQWKEALAEPNVWTHMRHRVAELDEPQLTEAAVDALAMEMPAALLRPVVDLLSRTDKPSRLAKVARNWPAPPSVRADLLDRITAPLVETIRTGLADTLRQFLDGGASAAPATVDRLLTEVVPAVRRLNALEPAKNHHRTASVRDTTAIALNNCAMALLDNHRLHDDEPIEEWLRLAKKLVCDRELGLDIEVNLYRAEEWRRSQRRMRRSPVYTAPVAARPPSYTVPGSLSGTAGTGTVVAGVLVMALVLLLLTMCVSGEWTPFSIGPLPGTPTDAVADRR